MSDCAEAALQATNLSLKLVWSAVGKAPATTAQRRAAFNYPTKHHPSHAPHPHNVRIADFCFVYRTVQPILWTPSRGLAFNTAEIGFDRNVSQRWRITVSGQSWRRECKGTKTHLGTASSSEVLEQYWGRALDCRRMLGQWCHHNIQVGKQR